MPVAAAKARAHTHLFRERFDGPTTIEPRSDRVEQGGKAVIGTVHFEQSRKLRLRPRPAIIDDHLPRRALGDLVSEILGRQRQGQINPRANARRGPYPSLPNVDSVGARLHLGKLSREARRASPVGRGRKSVQQAGGREDERAGTDAAEPPGVLVRLAKGLEGPVAGHRASGPQPARHHQRVDRLDVRKRFDGELDSAGRARASRLLSRHNDPIGFLGGKARCDLEDGDRPGRIQELKVVEEEEGDGSDHVLK
jgi:hypothetical protein